VLPWSPNEEPAELSRNILRNYSDYGEGIASKTTICASVSEERAGRQRKAVEKNRRRPPSRPTCPTATTAAHILD